MARDKSALKNIVVTTASKPHYCRNNKEHKIGQGDIRYTVKERNRTFHYCSTCAKMFLRKDINKLTQMLKEF